MDRSRFPAGLVILVLLLTVWNPGSLALHAASRVWNIGSHSTLSLVFLGVRLVITSIGVAAGLALWLRRPGAVRFAQVTLMLFGLEAVFRLSTRADLSASPPGTRLPLALFLIAHNAGWYLYLQRSRRVRSLYGLESHP